MRPEPARRAALLIAALCLASSPAAPRPDSEETVEEARPRLSPLDFKVFDTERPLEGTYEFDHPITGERRKMRIEPAPDGEGGLAGILLPEGLQIFSLSPKKEGVGYEGEVKGLLGPCGQEKVPVTDLLPLGETVILRLDARPPETPCPFLEDPARTRMIVAPSPAPVLLRTSRDIVSERTREQIGLAGQPGGVATPIVAGAVSIEGGTELRYRGRTRSLDGSMWIEVESIVSPAPGIEPPRGFLRADELRIDASLAFVRLDAPEGRSGG